MNIKLISAAALAVTALAIPIAGHAFSNFTDNAAHYPAFRILRTQ